MNHRILISFFLFFSVLFGSGGYDNGTATGRGKFQLDITWNPFDKIEFGQTYAIISYGITDQLDLHGYISRHTGPFHTWYAGIFYQFYNSHKIDLATAIGLRKRFDESWIHIFMPQILYTVNINDSFYLGGSLVDVRNRKNSESIGVAIDTGIFYKLKYKTKYIESISFGISGLHPATWKPKTYFLPTYSVDIKFK